MWDKKQFVPFLEERNHLGRLIDSKASGLLKTKRHRRKLYISPNNKISIKQPTGHKSFNKIGYGKTKIK